MISFRKADLLDEFKPKVMHFVEFGYRCGPQGCQVYFKGIPDIKVMSDEQTDVALSERFKGWLKAMGWGVAAHIDSSSPYKNLVGVDADDPTRYLDLTFSRFLRISLNTEIEGTTKLTAESESEQRGIFYFKL